MRTITRACMLCLSIMSLHVATYSQQVAKSIPNSTSPDGVIGFLQFTPKDYGSQKHPLIIFMHGIGERGNGSPSEVTRVAANAIPKFCAAGASMRFTVAGVTSSFVVLSPQLSTQYGSWPPFYVQEMIKYAKANLQIDPNRIYVCGLSLGGGGVWRALTEVTNNDYSFDGTIAAAAPCCGTQEEVDANVCATIAANHLPIWAFHSMDDGTVPVGCTQHADLLLQRCSGMTPAPRFTYYQSGGHGGAWLNAFDTGHNTVPVVVGGVVSYFTANPNLYEWFLSHTRSIAQTYTAPVANAGAAQIITLPLSIITLTGSGTGTNGATIASYSWTKTSGPAGGVINLPLLNISLVTGLVQGTYVFTLTVTDNHGLTNSSTVTITVNGLLNTAPVANAGSPQTITLPTSTVNLTGTGTGTNGASISSYAWSKTSGPASGSISSPGAANTALTGLVQGTYVFKLTVTDNHGLTGTSTVTINVNAANAAPVASAGSAQTITLPLNTITLTGTGTGLNGATISSYAWVKTSGPASVFISNPSAASTAVGSLVQGTYVFTLTVKDNNGLTSSASVTITVNSGLTVAGKQPIGYIKQSVGITQACADASSAGRIPIYSNGIANGNIVYLDAGFTTRYNGGYNWFSLTPVLGGAVTEALSIFPDGVIHMLSNCSGTPPATASAGTPGTLLGYLKISSGPYQACSDASSTGRTAVYGKAGIANGSMLYTDSSLTQVYNGGFNWFSFTPVQGGPTTYAFAVYPIGSILLLRNCLTGGSARVAAGSVATTTAEEDIATLNHLRDSAALAEMVPLQNGKLNIYPNPVRTSATIAFNCEAGGAKTVCLYNSNGVLTAKYAWQTIRGNNTFTLNNIAGLPGGLYIADIRDSNGKPVGKLKFIKQ